MAARRRLDAELVRRGLAGSRGQAARLVAEGHVLVAGTVADKPARLVGAGEALHLVAPPSRFVGRGGEKLAGALAGFSIDPRGLVVLDAGASTGGFTDCLLQAGAARVVAVDVGRGQLHERLRADPRVVTRERTDVRSLRLADLGPQGPGPAGFALEVADLSFISSRSYAASLVALAAPGATIVVLVKPQFEAGRAEVSRGRGVVRSPEVWRKALIDAIAAMEASGAANMGVMVSPLRGAEGNVEFFARFEVASPPAGEPGAGELPMRTLAPSTLRAIDAVVAAAGGLPAADVFTPSGPADRCAASVPSEGA